MAMLAWVNPHNGMAGVTITADLSGIALPVFGTVQHTRHRIVAGLALGSSS